MKRILVVSLLAGLCGCHTFVKMKPDYADLPVDTLREVAHDIEQAVHDGNREADIPEIAETLEKLGNVNPEKVMLMPQAATRNEYLVKSLMVADLCKWTGYAFCQRLHVFLWDGRRGT